jgi:hypothetical protein
MATTTKAPPMTTTAPSPSESVDVDAGADINISDEVDADADVEPERQRPERRTTVRQNRAPRESRDPQRSVVTSSPELRGIRSHENATLAEIIKGLGEKGSFTIAVKRVEPEFALDPDTRKQVRVNGHLKTYDEVIEDVDEFLLQRHGGGKYELTFKKRNEVGRLVFVTSRRVEIAGDPRTDDIPRNIQTPTQQAPQPQGEAPSLVNKTFDILTGELAAARQKQSMPTEVKADPMADRMMGMLQRQLDNANQQLETFRKEIGEIRGAKPPEDPFRERLLDTLMKDDSSRLQAVRMQYESEIRSLKENHLAEERRLRDQADRDKSDLRMSFEREIATLRQVHQSEIASLRQSHEIQMSAAKTAYDTNVKLLESDSRKLERDNAELRVEVKELRAKKEVGLPEMIKQVEAVKDMVGGDEDKGVVGHIMEALPGAIEMVSQRLQPKAAAEQPKVDTKKQIVQDDKGNRYLLDASGKLVPVKKKTQQQKVAAAPPDPETGLPPLDPAVVKQIIEYLERAFANNTEPEVFAQSSRSMVPEEILTAISQLGGVDPFLAKVAKLPSTSPLASQAGKNWVRKVGKALVGE